MFAYIKYAPVLNCIKFDVIFSVKRVYTQSVCVCIYGKIMRGTNCLCVIQKYNIIFSWLNVIGYFHAPRAGQTCFILD